MKVDEFSNEFDILYNNITSNQAPGLDEYEKSVFLTKAQDEIIKSYFNPRLNKTQEGFDGNERRQIDFSMILKSKVIYPTNVVRSRNFEISTYNGNVYNNEQLKDTELTFTVPYNKIPVKVNNVSVNNNTVSIHVDKPYELLKYIDTNYHKFQIPEDQSYQEFSITIGDYNWKEDYGWDNPKFDTRENTKSVSFPSDILMFINEYAEVIRDGKNKRLVVIPISYTEYSRVMSKPFKRPLKNQAWRLLEGTGDNKSADIIIGANDTLRIYGIRYLKRPNPIVLVDLTGSGLSINGEYRVTNCELDEILHPEILQRAVELAKAAYIGDLNSQVALGQTSGTNMGIVTQSK